jgi:hypothetical protein
VSYSLTISSRTPPTDSRLNNFISTHDYSFVKKTFQQLICEDLGINQQYDFPIAALECSNVSSIKKNEYIYNVAPCFFSLQRDYYRFEHNLSDDFTDIEYSQLCDELNILFKDKDSRFFLNHNRLFFATTLGHEIITYFPEEINHINERKFLPQGKGALIFHKLINEIQMFLHDWELNKKREEAGSYPANTLWFSGGGQLPVKVRDSSQPKTILTNLKLFQNVNLLFPEIQMSTYNHNETFKALKYDSAYFHFNSDEYLSRYLDYFFDELKSKKYKKIALRIVVGNACLLITTSSLGKFKFWKAKKVISELFNAS